MYIATGETWGMYSNIPWRNSYLKSDMVCSDLHSLPYVASSLVAHFFITRKVCSFWDSPSPSCFTSANSLLVKEKMEVKDSLLDTATSDNAFRNSMSGLQF